MSKRALIVDDSRSARVILSRMLESYGLAVDSAESAEQALEYLQHERPDVIFMDHLMPGMDGFQAVAAIKANPDTAMIPVVMYTSQEGELYVSQARALGAVGVLPKTVKQVDVSQVLHRLHLLPERREARTQTLAHAAGHDAPVVQVEPRPTSVAGEIETAIRSATAPLLKEHLAELRRFMLASLEAFARRISAESNPQSAPPPAVEIAPAAEESTPPAAGHWRFAAAAVGLALVSTIILGALYVRTLEDLRALTQANAQLAAAVKEQQGQLAAIQQAQQSQSATAAALEDPASKVLVEYETTPYGETPLAGARLERLRAMIDDLKTAGFRGRIQVTTYVGEFCLTGNGLEGYSMAPDDLPARRCDLRGNPFDDSLTAAQRQSLAFANLIAAVRQDTGDSLSIHVAHGGRQPIAPYPRGDLLSGVTAGEWNKIAAQNNRVEFTAEPGA